MKSAESKLFDILEARGDRFSADDYRDAQLILIDMPADEVHEIEAWFIEALTLIVANPAYQGDMTIDDLQN